MKPEDLGRYRQLIEQALEQNLPPVDPKDPGRLCEAMRYSVLGGGKRLRPVVVLAAAEACGADPGQGEILSGACSVEMIHAYSLVHDDLPAMDDDDTRRGRPSCHKAFGEAAAILAGDGLLTLAFESLATPPANIERLRAVSELAQAAGWNGLVGGQSLDLYCEPDSLQSLEDVERIHLGKTAALFRASAVIGGVLARGSDSQVEELRGYGTSLGLAFQHIDDALDDEHSRFANQALQRGRNLLEKAQRGAEAFGERGWALSAVTDLVASRLEKADAART
jgi:geranylgeranyl diphosphate synthase type II